MPFKEHPVFKQPEDPDHVIWRYLHGTQFISLLQNRGLYFNRADKFEDPFEGIFPKERLVKEYIDRQSRHKIEEIMVDQGIFPEDVVEEQKSPREALFEIINVFRKSSYMNCWHMNDSESMAMWKAYISEGDGVIIKSRYSKLKDALDRFDDYTYRMGQVGYLPWLEDGIEKELSEKERNNWLYPFVYKQKEYEYEREVRAIVSKDAWDNGQDTTGFFVPTDLNELIDSVIVAPTSPPWANIEFWEDICRKYKLRTTVETSSLDTTPSDILDEIDAGDANTEVRKRVEAWREKQDFIS